MELELLLRFLMSIGFAGAGSIARYFVNGNEIDFAEWNNFLSILLTRVFLGVFFGILVYLFAEWKEYDEVLIMIFTGLSGFFSVELGPLLVKLSPQLINIIEENIKRIKK